MVMLDEETGTAVRAAREQLPADVSGERVVFGFDGFLDRVREVVNDRSGPDTYERLPNLSGFSARVGDSVAADSSLSVEWIQRGTRTGGHTCHLGRAFGKWGYEPVLFGMYGDPIREPFEREFGTYDVFTLGEPGLTDAIEFDDGKLMLIENGDSMELDWDTLVETVGPQRLTQRLDGAALLGVGYWAETPNLPNVIDGLCERLSAVENPPGTVIVDPGDVRKLDRGRLREGRTALADLDGVVDVVLTANRAETALLAGEYGDATGKQAGGREAATELYDAIDVSAVVCHGVDRSTVVTHDGITSVDVPVADDPELTTSAGDHFNAGLALALVEGIDPGPAVAVGNAVAGRFVRTGEPPSLSDVCQFLDDYDTYF